MQTHKQAVQQAKKHVYGFRAVSISGRIDGQVGDQVDMQVFGWLRRVVYYQVNRQAGDQIYYQLRRQLNGIP